jgi:methyl-accepting chemotaxis protein/methyl-accepting chemotaxis protein-1 (serine sensor receptor)
MTRQMSIQAKLFSSFGIVLTMAVVNAVHSSLAVRDIRNQLTGEISASVTLLDESRQVTIGIANMRSAMRGITLFSLQNNPTQFAKARSSFDKSADDMRKTVDQMAAARLTAEEGESVATIRSGLERWSENFRHFSDLCASGHGAEGNQFVLQNITPTMDALQKAAAELGRVSSLRQNAGTLAAEKAMNRAEVLNVVLCLTVTVAGSAALVIVVGLVNSLKRIARSLLHGSRQVAESASQVSSASTSLSQGSSEQAASLEETSASTEEINSMARKNTENSLATAAIVTDSGQKFESANKALGQMISAMDEISGSSDKISRIIKVIDEIAFQTNILALNAAVEAARAGEAGMGFAVVADEVRNLAQRCAQAARDTASLIEESINKSRDGRVRVDSVARAIREVTESATKTKVLVDEVSLGSQEQSRGIEQIARAITQMEQVTQQTAAAAEEGAAAAEELNAQSQGLHNLATELTAMVHNAELA